MYQAKCINKFSHLLRSHGYYLFVLCKSKLQKGTIKLLRTFLMIEISTLRVDFLIMIPVTSTSTGSTYVIYLPRYSVLRAIYQTGEQSSLPAPLILPSPSTHHSLSISLACPSLSKEAISLASAKSVLSSSVFPS